MLRDHPQIVIFFIPSQVAIIAGELSGNEPTADDDEATMQAWVAKCTESEATADEAVFSDISSIASFKLISETKPLVYISSMSTNVVRSFDPETRMCPSRLFEDCFGFSHMAGMCSLFLILIHIMHLFRLFRHVAGAVKHVLGNGSRDGASEGSIPDPFCLCADSRGRMIVSCLEDYTIRRFDPTADEQVPTALPTCLLAFFTCWFV